MSSQKSTQTWSEESLHTPDDSDSEYEEEDDTEDKEYECFMNTRQSIIGSHKCVLCEQDKSDPNIWFCVACDEWYEAQQPTKIEVMIRYTCFEHL